MLALTAGVDSLDFIHPIKVGDLIILKSRVTCVFNTSLEVEVEVFSEAIQTRRAQAHEQGLPDVRVARQDGKPAKVPPLLIETPEDEERLPRCASPPRRAPEKKSRGLM